MKIISRKKKTGRKKTLRVNILRHLGVVIILAAAFATVFTAWNPYHEDQLTLAERLKAIFTFDGSNDPGSYPTPTPQPRPTIGLIPGHQGESGGAECSDGLNELMVNQNVAFKVMEMLVADGYDVDMLDELSPELDGYYALALVSIHSDSCEFINEQATGFKVSPALDAVRADKSERLAACLTSRYMETSGLPIHTGSITVDMTYYYAFDIIRQDIAAAIIELGFLNLDRQILTEQPDLLAEGIYKGIICYIHNEDATLPTGP
jgi:N-acetylmuramoyl-L-alanine amidase